MNATQGTIKTTTLEEALTEAQLLGFCMAETTISTHRPIDEWLEELVESGECDDGYVLFGSVIIRITDAWQRDAEIIHLD